MKLDDFNKARSLVAQLHELKRKLDATEKAREFQIPVYQSDKEFRFVLGDHDAPSEIGETFRSVRTFLIALLNKQIKEVEVDLEKLGVSL